jgi:hypothetical protein
MTLGVNVINVFLSQTLVIKKLACLFFSYLIFAAKLWSRLLGPLILNFFVLKLRIFIISYSVCIGELFQSSLTNTLA